MSNYEDDAEEIELIDICLDDEEEEADVTDTGIAEPEVENEDDSPKSKRLHDLISYAIILVAAVVIALVVNNFVIINAHVPSSSMESTINVNDNLIGFRLAYLFSEPERGDIVIFKFPDDESKVYIKRVIGTPGDTVEILNGVLYINGEIIEEDYIKEPMHGTSGPYEVPEGCYFMMGDNRNVSDDARYWNNTYVAKEKILAKVLFRYSPSFSKIE